MVEDQIVLPYAKQGLLGDVYENARVLSEDYDTTGRIMKVRGLPGAPSRACEEPSPLRELIAGRSASQSSRKSCPLMKSKSDETLCGMPMQPRFRLSLPLTPARLNAKACSVPPIARLCRG